MLMSQNGTQKQSGDALAKVVGANLKRILLDHGYKTQEALARELNTATNLINAVERGKRNMGKIIRNRLVEKLHIDPKELYKTEEQPQTVDANVQNIFSQSKAFSRFIDLPQETKDRIATLVDIYSSPDAGTTITALNAIIDQYLDLHDKKLRVAGSDPPRPAATGEPKSKLHRRGKEYKVRVG